MISKTTQKKTHKEVLLENAEEIIDMISGGSTYNDIKEKFKSRREDISWFISTSDFSARARQAQKESAETYFEKAEKAILEIESADTNAKVARQRELAHHYRWAAKVKNPQRFSDSTTLRGDSESPLNPSVNVILNK